MKVMTLPDGTYLFIANDGYHFESTKHNEIMTETLGTFRAIGYTEKNLPKTIKEVKN